MTRASIDGHGVSALVLLLVIALVLPAAGAGTATQTNESLPETTAQNDNSDDGVTVSVAEASGDRDDGIVTADARFGVRVATESEQTARIVVSKDGQYQNASDLTAVGDTAVFDLSTVSDAAGGWTVSVAADETAPAEPAAGTHLANWSDARTRLLVGNSSRVRAAAADDAWQSGTHYWRGNVLFLKSDRVAAEAGASWTLYEVTDGGLVRIGGLRLDENAEALVSTERIEGRYIVVAESGSLLAFDAYGRVDGRVSEVTESAIRDASIEVTTQELAVETENATVASSATTLHFDSERARYNVTATSEQLSTETLLTVFENADAVAVGETEDATVEFQLTREDDSVPLTLSTVERGQYAFEFAVVDSTAEASATVPRLGEEDVTATFVEPGVGITEGSLARFPIRLANTDRTTVYVGSRENNYLSAVEVVDDDGDGLVVLEMNTWLAGRSIWDNRRAFTAAGGTVERVTLRTDPLSDPPLDPAMYDLNTTVDGVGKSATLLGIRDQSIGELRTWTAPADATFENRTEIRTAIQRGTLTRDETVARGELVVFELQAPGLVGELAARLQRSGSDEAALVETVVDSSAFAFNTTQANPGPNVEPARLDLRATHRADGLTVVPSPKNGTVYVVLDTDRAVLTKNDEGGPLAAGDALRTNFSLGESHGVVDDRRSAGIEWRVVDRRVTLRDTDSGPVHVRNATCQVISAQSTLTPGTELSFRLRGTDASFNQIAQPVVADDGRVELVTDFSAAPANTTVRLSSPDANVGGRTVRVVDRPPAAIGIANQSATRTATVEAVRLPFGGFVVLYDAETLDPLGRSDRLDSGTSRRVTVALERPVNGSQAVVAVPHTDGSLGNQTDRGAIGSPYQRDCEAVTATAVLSELPENTTQQPRSDPETVTTAAAVGQPAQPIQHADHSSAGKWRLAEPTTALSGAARGERVPEKPPRAAPTAAPPTAAPAHDDRKTPTANAEVVPTDDPTTSSASTLNVHGQTLAFVLLFAILAAGRAFVRRSK